MVLVSNGQSAIIRTERGLTIAGTRITLYDVMDYLKAQYPPIVLRLKPSIKNACRQRQKFVNTGKSEIVSDLPRLRRCPLSLVKKPFVRSFKSGKHALNLNHELSD